MRTLISTSLACGVIMLCGGTAARPACAQPNLGLEWATIADVNNIPLNRGTGLDGWGSVAWQYRIAKTEVPTSLWVEFYSAVYARSTPLAIRNTTLFIPLDWGGESDPTYSGPGRRYRVRQDVPNAGMIPATSITWRDAAVLTNWLHNDKRTDAAAFMNGAYDTETFATNPDGTYTDQPYHHPNAKFWLPTADEWMKAAFFDPAKDGSGGWWLRPNRSDTSLTYGPPGQGDANAGFRLPGNAERLIPLGAYPNVQSAYGLLDVAGGASEWSDSTIGWSPSDRALFGSQRSETMSSADFGDRAGSLLGSTPSSVSHLAGVRLASSIPAPGFTGILLSFVVVFRSRRRQA